MNQGSDTEVFSELGDVGLEMLLVIQIKKELSRAGLYVLQNMWQVDLEKGVGLITVAPQQEHEWTSK